MVAGLLFPTGVLVGILLGVGAVVIAARTVVAPLRTQDPIIQYHTDRLTSLPVISHNESQEAEISKQMDGYIPPVFDNLEGLGAIN